MTALSTSEEIQLTEATSTFFRLIAMDRVWTTVGSRPDLDSDDISALSAIVDEMHDLVGRAIDAANDVATIARKTGPYSRLPDPALVGPQVLNVLEPLLRRGGGLPGIAQQAYEILKRTSGAEVATLNRQMDIIQAGGHIEADLSRRFMCNLAKSLMAAAGITVWVPPHVHSADSLSAGATIFAVNKCWELEPAA